jgi:hypothetical protein
MWILRCSNAFSRQARPGVPIQRRRLPLQLARKPSIGAGFRATRKSRDRPYSNAGTM